MIYQVKVYPNEILNQKSNSLVSNFKEDTDFKVFLDNLLETVRAYRGVGLSAVQVGVLFNVFVLNTDKERVCINPTVLETSGMDRSKEGCLSFPGAYSFVIRPATTKVAYFGIDGERVEETLTGLTARAFLHEYDHCQGTLMTARMPGYMSESLIKKSRKYRRLSMDF
jgi:peptide deformylase